MTLPTLTTERLLLRQRSLDDIPGYLEMDADAEVMRYIGDGTVPDLATHAERIKQRIITGNADGLWVWSVFERDRPADLLGCMFLSLPVPPLRLGARNRHRSECGLLAVRIRNSQAQRNYCPRLSRKRAVPARSE
jgi:RimJ/RimL family protein N-acetyltransferase